MSCDSFTVESTPDDVDFGHSFHLWWLGNVNMDRLREVRAPGHNARIPCARFHLSLVIVLQPVLETPQCAAIVGPR